MHRGVLFVLLAIFATYGRISVSAERVANDVDIRRLRADAVPVSAVKTVVSPKQVKAVVSAGTRLNERLIKMRAFKQVMSANGNEASIKAAIQMAANARAMAKVSDSQAAKLVSQLLVEGVKKSPKSWPRLRKLVMITLGAQVGVLAIYGSYKLLTKDSAVTVIPTTTTESA
ncbi:RxLR effector protein [Phytophthora megakarya]|uniref:RxLR effector protein n=1 Tax=Phytophthora megakarya TaxID=4795 RepID=A0A225UJK2_9STRA|nr:RxLR effector protein [Phytophthora megakarya]